MKRAFRSIAGFALGRLSPAASASSAETVDDGTAHNDVWSTGLASRGVTFFLATIALGIISAPAPSYAVAIQPFTTVFDTDWTSAAIGGMRDGPGTATLSLSGVTGTVNRSYLYWHGPDSTGDANANANVMFAGTDVTGTSLGLSNDNCWGFADSIAYRADVSSLVTGDGDYSLANFVKPNLNINGVSLVVFFDDGDSTNNRDVVLFDGNDSNIDNTFDSPGWNISLAGINYSSGTASIVMGVSDGQTFPDDALILNGSELAPAGGVFDGVFAQDAGSGSPGNGLLWDLRPFDVTSFLTAGLNTLTLTTGVTSDCLSCIHVAIDLPAGAAPPINDVPEPSTLILLAMGLFCLWHMRNRVGASWGGKTTG